MGGGNGGVEAQLVQDSLRALGGEMGKGSRSLGKRRWEWRPDWCKAGSRQQQEKGLDLFLKDLLGRRGRNKVSGIVREGWWRCRGLIGSRLEGGGV